MSIYSLLFVGCCVVADPGFTAVADRPVPELVRAESFDEAMNKHISVRWANVDVRTILERLTTEYHFAFLRDRRIDPDAVVSFSTTPKPARDVVSDVGALAGGEVQLVGNTAYVGPPAAAGKLQTLIALRSDELAGEKRIADGQRRRLVEHQTIQWQDLEQPAQILENIAGQYGLTVEGKERIPHDVWGGAAFVAENAAEAISLVLIQFDLTFRWRDRGTAIELLPVPESVMIVQDHRPRPHSTQQAIKMVREAMPELDVHADRGRVVVSGTIEQHEAVERLLHPPDPAVADATPAPSDDPLKYERMTLRVMGVPALALMKDLEKRYQLVFEYDEKVLAAAGVDFTQKVKVDVSQTTIDGYLTAFLSQVGANFDRTGRRVNVRPATTKK